MKLPVPGLDLRKYRRYIATIAPIVVVLGTILILSGIIYVIYTGRYTSNLLRGVHAQTFLEMILIAIGYLVGLAGLLIAYIELKRSPRGSEDLILLGITLSFVAWLLIHYLYLWKRGA